MSTDDLPRRTERIRRVLGLGTDREVARLFGVSTHAAFVWRKELGIPPARVSLRRRVDKWVLQYSLESLLGTMPDEMLAKQIGSTSTVVRQLRIAAGIEPCRKQMQRKPSETRDGAQFLLGKMRDVEIAKRLGVSRERVRQLRAEQGIPKFRPPVDEEMVSLMPTTPDSVLAERYGLTTARVRKIRKARGIAPGPRKKRQVPKECRTCGAERQLSSGRLLCRACQAQAMRRRNARLKKEGMCLLCGKRRRSGGTTHCSSCLSKIRKVYRRNYRRKRAQLVASGLCVDCKNKRKSTGTSIRCRPCADRLNASRRKPRR